MKHVFRYGFVETADDILFALLVGVALGGVLYLVIPSDLVANEYARWLSYPLMALVGVPLYICASASTLIAGGWTLSVNLEASDSPAIQFLQWSGAFALLVLIVWRFRARAP